MKITVDTVDAFALRRLTHTASMFGYASYSDPAMPAWCTTLLQRPISELMKGCNSSGGGLLTAIMPRLISCCWISGNSRMLLSERLARPVRKRESPCGSASVLD